MTIVAGLTGGIATGKSTVSRILLQAGAQVIDADIIAREVVKIGLPAHEAIRRHFGDRVLGPDGGIDRRFLAKIIFADPSEKHVLNRIVHPRVLQAMADAVASIHAQSPGTVILLDIPLLFEAGMDEGLDEVIVVYIPEPLQLERLMQRDGLTQEDALARIRSQWPIEKKREKATLVIDNSGAIGRLREAALEVYSALRRRAAVSGKKAPVWPCR